MPKQVSPEEAYYSAEDETPFRGVFSGVGLFSEGIRKIHESLVTNPVIIGLISGINRGVLGEVEHDMIGDMALSVRANIEDFRNVTGWD